MRSIWYEKPRLSHYGPAVGAVFHVGDHFIIRPALFTSSSFVDMRAVYGIFADFLFSFPAGRDFMWYVGPAMTEMIGFVFETEAVALGTEVAVILGVQAMITERIAVYTGFGIAAGGQVNLIFKQGSFDYIDLRSSGIGVVFYLN